MCFSLILSSGLVLEELPEAPRPPWAGVLVSRWARARATSTQPALPLGPQLKTYPGGMGGPYYYYKGNSSR